jgi:8-oxo-dGTP diphosphatase
LFTTPIEYTLCVILDAGRILLGQKMRKWCNGYWMGPGGGVEDGESDEECAIREVEEETHIVVKKLYRVGHITALHVDTFQTVVVHVFLVSEFQGKPQSSAELGNVQWYNIENLHTINTFPTDTHWLPIVLRGGQFIAEFLYKRGTTLLFGVVLEIRRT